ncbi:transglutaminaseTgpA domain-containing protein [Streptomyces sp. NPDC001667]
MSGSARLAVCAVVATLASACALLPLIDTTTWMVQAAILLTVQSAVGALARRVPLARPLTVAVQALVTLVLLTLVFARAQALGGLLPGPDVFREFGQLLQEGSDDVGRFAIPAPATTGIRLMLVGGLLVVGLTVDAVAVTWRSAAPAGLPLLALYSIAAGLAQSGKDWLWFLVAAAGYLLLLLAEGRDRLARWGRVFGGGARSPSPRLLAPGSGPALAPVRTGRRIGALALGIALAVPAVLPTMEGGLLEPRGQAAASDREDSSGFDAVRPLVTLRDSLNQPENREVMRYRTSTESTREMYLRIVALDRFDGASWQPSERRVTGLPEVLPTPAGLAPGVRTEPVNTSVAAAGSYAQNYLPLPYPAERVRVDGHWRYEPEGRTVAGDRGQTTRGVRYQVSSLLVQPTAAQLAGAPAPREEVLREYTKVPGSLPEVVGATARKVTAGSANAYEQAVRLQDWFAADGGFSYDTEVASGGGSDAIAKFLDAKRGFCIHFSFSMAAMARTLGIPARVAVGFTPGTPLPDGSMSVGSKDAHAWPELYFEGVGWTRFEPTPSRGTAPDYTAAQEPSGADPGAPAPLPDRSTAPSARPPAASGCTPQLKRLGECPPNAPQATAGDGHGGGLSPGAVAGIAAGGLAVLVLPLLPLLWRRRLRARRLAGPGRQAESARAPAEPGASPEPGAEHILAAWAELTDSAWDYGVLPDESRTPRSAAARIVRLGGLTGVAEESAHRVATAVEQVLYAPRPRPPAGLAEDVERVRAGLRSSARRPARLRAVLAPRSAVRLVWGLSRRRTAAAGRLRSGRLGTAWRRAGGALRTARGRT